MRYPFVKFPFEKKFTDIAILNSDQNFLRSIEKHEIKVRKFHINNPIRPKPKNLCEYIYGIKKDRIDKYRRELRERNKRVNIRRAAYDKIDLEKYNFIENRKKDIRYISSIYDKFFDRNKSFGITKSKMATIIGRAEPLFFDSLQKKYKNYIFHNVCLIETNILDSVSTIQEWGGAVDFIYSRDFGNRRIMVNIEIDEPYEAKRGMPIHYIEYNEQEKQFTDFDFSGVSASNGLIIVRFSEEQIVTKTKICLEFIDSIIERINNNKIFIPEKFVDDFVIENDCVDFITNRWTFDLAKKMSDNDYRNKYLDIGNRIRRVQERGYYFNLSDIKGHWIDDYAEYVIDGHEVDNELQFLFISLDRSIGIGKCFIKGNNLLIELIEVNFRKESMYRRPKIEYGDIKFLKDRFEFDYNGKRNIAFRDKSSIDDFLNIVFKKTEESELDFNERKNVFITKIKAKVKHLKSNIEIINN